MNFGIFQKGHRKSRESQLKLKKICRASAIFYPKTLTNTNTRYQLIVSSLQSGYVLIDRIPPYITRLEAQKQGLAYIQTYIIGAKISSDKTCNKMFHLQELLFFNFVVLTLVYKSSITWFI